MIPYDAPVAEMRFVLNRVVGFDRVAALPAFESASPDMVDSILEEAGKFAAGVLAPTNAVGDKEGTVLVGDTVRTPAAIRAAYGQFVEAGWNGLAFDPDFGGQGMPWTLGLAVQEMWHAANMAFGLCPMLTQGAVELLQAYGSDEQKATYLPRMISGEWTGTMDLTEPQAGSDLGAVRTKAIPDGDTFRISGQKIFITYGEHDMVENIIHLVLARLPGAPAGSKGISLFIVPKFLVNADGSLGARNDVRCTGIEHKLGIKASPTAVLSYGDNGGAVGYLVGQPNRGLEYMFAMMNNARVSVGLEGVAISDRAYQQARDYARTRVQSRDMADSRGEPVAIIRHPDVRRMLLTMRALTEAGRALIYTVGVALDLSTHGATEEERAVASLRAELLTPVAKAWCTDMSGEVTSLGIQVHGGMGYIEETGAAQHYRDARITPIYEGTNGIQALDLKFRKIGRDKGAAARGFIAEQRAVAAQLNAKGDEALAVIARHLDAGLEALDEAVDWVAGAVKAQPVAAAAGAAHFLRLFGIVTGGALLARGALAAAEDRTQPGADTAFLNAKVLTARFYAEQILPQARGLLVPLTEGHATVMSLDEAAF